MITLRALDPGGAGRRQDELIELLEDAVESGASVGFLLPLEPCDPAEALYRSLGFAKFGEVPRSARSPDGRLAASSFYYLELHPAT